MTYPPNFLFEIRNFDVTLMILVGGMSFYISNTDKKINYLEYVKKRFKRLILPTWIFLTIFFISFFLLCLLTKNLYPFNLKTIIESYGLIDGIGYVWIMRVFFLVAIISPYILRISNTIKSNTKYFIGLLGIYTIYLLAIFINSKFSPLIRAVIENSVIHMMGWGLIVAIGIRLIQLNKKELKLYTLIFFGIYIILMFCNNFTCTQEYKYPPTLYYISYGIFMSLLLLQIVRLKKISMLFTNAAVKYIATNSLSFISVILYPYGY